MFMTQLNDLVDYVILMTYDYSVHQGLKWTKAPIEISFVVIVDSLITLL